MKKSFAVTLPSVSTKIFCMKSTLGIRFPSSHNRRASVVHPRDLDTCSRERCWFCRHLPSAFNSVIPQYMGTRNHLSNELLDTILLGWTELEG